MARTTLKITELPKTLRDIIEEAVAVRAELRDLTRIERTKVSAACARRLSCEAAGIDEKRLAELRERVPKLPHSQEFAALHRFVALIKERAQQFPGDLVPPRENLCPPQLYQQLLAACLNAKISTLELVAHAWDWAARERPECFAEGCDDPTAHEKRIEELKRREQELLVQASHATEMSDLLFAWRSQGVCAVTYALSDGTVPASGPGDVRGPGALAAWLEAQQQ